MAHILQPGAIKPLQKKSAQPDDEIKIAPVKPQTAETNLGKCDGNKAFFLFDSCINLRNIQCPHCSTQMFFLFPQSSRCLNDI